MSVKDFPEGWKIENSIHSIEKIAPEDRLQYLEELPPGGIYWALCYVQDWFDGLERLLVVNLRSHSKIECDTSCEDARYEARETIEVTLQEMVNLLNDAE